MDLIKKRFVGKVLQEEGKRLIRNQGAILYKRLVFREGVLRDSRGVSVRESDAMDGELTFKHVDYERFLDMKRKVKNKRGESRTRKGYNIHNRFTYGTYHVIALRLMNDLTDEVREGIRNELKMEGHG